MSPFTCQNGELYAESVPVSAIAEALGTPVYIYSRAELEARYLAYARALDGMSGMICYAVKANGNLAVLNVLARLGAGFDIVSIGELEKVIAAGGDPARTVFSGVGKRTDELARALEAGVYCFNVESESELYRLQKVAAAAGKMARISLRVNPDVDARTHPYISTGLKENKFGIAIERAEAVYEKAVAMPDLEVSGVDCHIGSQITTIAPFLDALDLLLKLIDQLAQAGIAIRHLDLGGGLGITYQNEKPPAPDVYVAAIRERLDNRDLELILEPGRSIAGNAGILLTQVEILKHTEHKRFAIVDAAMNDLIRPSLYGSWHDIQPVKQNNGKAKCYDIVGPVCESSDFLGKERMLSLAEGDLLAIHSTGAYCMGMSFNYNVRCRPPEVMVDGDTYHVVRKRETLEALLAAESLLP